MARINRFAAVSALAAAVSMAAPAAATELPRGHVSAQAYDENANTAWDHHRWRGHRHDHIGGGDVLAGVLILGGIAAIAGAADKSHRDEEYRGPPPPPPARDGGYTYRGPGEGASGGLGHAADICVGAIERTIDPVGTIDGVRRGPAGWDVDGTLQNGSPFTCSIGNDGAIEDIRVDRSYSGAASDDGQSYGDDQSYQDNQWDDESYARAREEQAGDAADYDTGG